MFGISGSKTSRLSGRSRVGTGIIPLFPGELLLACLSRHCMVQRRQKKLDGRRSKPKLSMLLRRITQPSEQRWDQLLRSLLSSSRSEKRHKEVESQPRRRMTPMKPNGQAMVHPSVRCTRRLDGEGGSESQFQGDDDDDAPFGIWGRPILNPTIQCGNQSRHLALCPSLKVGGSSQHRPYAVDFIPPFLPLRSFCPFVSRHTHPQSDYASHGDKEPMARRNPPTDGFQGGRAERQMSMCVATSHSAASIGMNHQRRLAGIPRESSRNKTLRGAVRLVNLNKGSRWQLHTCIQVDCGRSSTSRQINPSPLCIYSEPYCKGASRPTCLWPATQFNMCVREGQWLCFEQPTLRLHTRLFAVDAYNLHLDTKSRSATTLLVIALPVGRDSWRVGARHSEIRIR